MKKNIDTKTGTASACAVSDSKSDVSDVVHDFIKNKGTSITGVIGFSDFLERLIRDNWYFFGKSLVDEVGGLWKEINGMHFINIPARFYDNREILRNIIKRSLLKNSRDFGSFGFWKKMPKFDRYDNNLDDDEYFKRLISLISSKLITDFGYPLSRYLANEFSRNGIDGCFSEFRKCFYVMTKSFLSVKDMNHLTISNIDIFTKFSEFTHGVDIKINNNCGKFEFADFKQCCIDALSIASEFDITEPYRFFDYDDGIKTQRQYAINVFSDLIRGCVSEKLANAFINVFGKIVDSVYYTSDNIREINNCCFDVSYYMTKEASKTLYNYISENCIKNVRLRDIDYAFNRFLLDYENISSIEWIICKNIYKFSKGKIFISKEFFKIIIDRFREEFIEYSKHLLNKNK